MGCGASASGYEPGTEKARMLMTSAPVSETAYDVEALAQMKNGRQCVCLQLWIRCKDLPKSDLLSKSDPQVIVYCQDPETQKWQTIGQTEIVKDCHDPTFSTPVSVVFQFELLQMLHFQVVDGDGGNTAEQLGAAETPLGRIVSHSGDTCKCTLVGRKSGSKAGTLYVTAEELSHGGCGTLISTGAADAPAAAGIPCKHLAVYESQNSDRSADRSWKKTELVESGSGLGRVTGGYHLRSSQNFAMQQSKYPSMGPAPMTFVGAVKAGMQIATSVALDYTGSNGCMHNVSQGPDGRNPYQECMETVAKILVEYDHDGIFPLSGYGGTLDGKFPPCFSLGDAAGVAGLLDLYAKTRNRIGLGDMGAARGGDMPWRANGGRYICDDFYAVINSVCDKAQKELESSGKSLSTLPKNYHILFFIIDGDGFDMEGTRRAMVRASALPVSIVLIGVGSSSFQNLRSFDADGQPLPTAEGITAVRDAVQYVRFEDFRNQQPGERAIRKVDLAAELLREVPTQVEQYLALYGCSSSEM